MEVGDEFKIPKKFCGHIGEIVWISKDKKTIAVQCHKYHSKNPVTKEQYTEKVSVDLDTVKVKTRKKDITYMFELNDSELKL